MTVREANLTASSSADREPEPIETTGTARLHLTLSTADYDHVRDLTTDAVRAEEFCLRLSSCLLRKSSTGSSRTANGTCPRCPSANSSVMPLKSILRSSESPSFRLACSGTRRSTFARIAASGSGGQTRGYPGMGTNRRHLCARISVRNGRCDLRKIQWVQAGMNEAGREEKVEFKLPDGIHYEQRRDTTISAMLLSGEIDAAISARVPDAFDNSGGRIVRLYPDYRAQEMDYHATTGIYPIMHVIAMRRVVFERYPWVAMNLFKAFDEARRRSLERIRDRTASRIPVP